MLLALLAVVACGDDEADTTSASGSAGAGGSAGASSWDGYCDTRASLSCPEFDAAACKEQEACGRALVRDVGEGQLLECLRQSCPWDLENGCMSELAALPMSQAGQAFLEECNTRATECGSSDDNCYSGYVLADEAIAELDACLAAATCDETEACIAAFFTDRFEACRAWL